MYIRYNRTAPPRQRDTDYTITIIILLLLLLLLPTLTLSLSLTVPIGFSPQSCRLSRRHSCPRRAEYYCPRVRLCACRSSSIIYTFVCLSVWPTTCWPPRCTPTLGFSHRSTTLIHSLLSLFLLFFYVT